MSHVAVIGLGLMGTGIAQNILQAGWPVTVTTRSPEKAADLLAAGAQWAASPAQAAADADVVISVVGDDEASRAIWLGAQGALAALRPDAIGVECATVSLKWMRELHAAAQARGAHFIDAPLGGSKLAAASATLMLFIGAEAETLDRARPVLAAFASTLIHFGPPTSGTIYKLVNNLQGGIHLLALGEGIALAERAGLNMHVVGQTLNVGAVSSPIVKGKIPTVISRQHAEPHFALKWMAKDLSYALEAAEELGVPTPLVALARDLYRQAMRQGLAELDFAAVTELAREWQHPITRA